MPPPVPAELDAHQRALLERGREQFNRGEWFEAHETWETLWHTLDDEASAGFVQVLIQCAVALEHVRRGNARGALTMLDRADHRLARTPPRRFGLDAEALLHALQHFAAPLRRLPRQALKPRRRQPALPVDLAAAPTLTRDDEQPEQ